MKLDKSTQVNVIFDDESADFLERKSREAGLKRTEYLRRLVYDAMDKEREESAKSDLDLLSLRDEMHARFDEQWTETVSALLSITSLVGADSGKNLDELRKASRKVADEMLARSKHQMRR